MTFFRNISILLVSSLSIPLLAQSAKESTAVVIPEYDTNYDKVVKVIDQIKLVGGLTVSIGK